MIQKSDNCIISYISDMRFSEETYQRLKNIHPKLRKNIEKLKIDSYYIFPHYHGCGK